MRSARALISLVALAAGLAAAFVLVPGAVKQLGTLTVPTLSPPASGAPAYPAVRTPAAQSVTSRRPATSIAAAAEPSARARGAERRGSSLGLLELLVGLLLLGGVVLICGAAALFAAGRACRRRKRAYGLYELHLSTHDQAKAQDLEDMVESIANIVRAWPADRVRHGQPYFALELICSTVEGPGDVREMEWSIHIRCEPSAVVALDGALSAAYPDVRLGRVHGERPRPRPGRLREPGYVMRFRKERSFVYSLIADGEQLASSPLEQIARAQIAQNAPSVVRFQLTPTPSYFEELARRLYRRHENKLVRQERWGLPEGGLTSTFNRAEMRAAERTQNRSLFWLETVVAADNREVCKAVAAAVQSRRGENRLHRRWIVHPPGPLPPPLPARARPANSVVQVPRIGRRGGAPARAAIGADEGRSRTAGDDPANPRAAGGRPRHPPRRSGSTRAGWLTPRPTLTYPAPSTAPRQARGRRELRCSSHAC